MFYLGRCKRCGHLIVSDNDVLKFKNGLASHLSKSHKEPIDDFLADISLEDFRDVFTIYSIKNEEDIAMLKAALTKGAFWFFFRNATVFAKDVPKPSFFSDRVAGRIAS